MGFGLESSGQLREVQQRYVPLTTFNRTDVSAMEAGEGGELLLREV